MQLTNENVDQFFRNDLCVRTRTIYLGDTNPSGEIDPESASRVIKSLHILQSISKEPIRILMNTDGGCVQNGLAIFDSISDCECYVTVEVIGSAMSMGAVILQSADCRLMHKNSILMMHEGSSSLTGTVAEVSNWAEFVNQQSKMLYRIFSERTGRTPKYWERRCSSDYILTADKALKEGLIDEICGRE